MKRVCVKLLIVLLMFPAVYSCKDDIDSYYERPEYLRGTAWQYLAEKGNYSYFLKAADTTGYRDALDGRGIYSVFAPNDEAFKKYMTHKGKTALEEFNIDSLRQLIAYHMVEFSFSRNDFLAFSKTSSSEDGKVGDGSSYRFKTLAREKPILMLNPQTNRNVKVFQQEKFLPILSTRLFKTQESSNYEADYRLFFPSVNWLGDDDQLYAANAAVTGSGIPVDNGYMYEITDVVEPLPTVYAALATAKSSDGEGYDFFREMYDRFAYIKYDEDATKNYAALGDSLFMFYHYLETGSAGDLPDIANQWTVSEKNTDYEERMKITYNCFAPKNNVLQDYIRTFFVNETDITKIPLLSLYYLLGAHLEDKKTIMLPSAFDKGLEGKWGEQWDISRENLKTKEFCCNGILYGIDSVLQPAVFTILTQPLFKYNRFSVMANVAHQRKIYEQLIDTENEFSIFIVSDSKLKEKYGMQVDLNANPTNVDLINSPRVEIKKFESETSSKIVVMPAWEQMEFITSHVVNGYVEPGVRGKRKYYQTKKQYYYIYTDNDLYYAEDGTELSVVNTWEYRYPTGGRGIAMEVEDKFRQPKDDIGKMLFRNSDRFRKFYQYLVKANLIVLNPAPAEGATIDPDKTAFKMDWLNSEQCMVFAPTNDVWDDSQIPVDSLELDRFLKYHFVSLEENKVEDYVLPNYGINNSKFKTRMVKKGSQTEKAELTVSWGTTDGRSLKVDNGERGILTDEKIPIFAADGVIFGLVGMLKAKN